LLVGPFQLLYSVFKFQLQSNLKHTYSETKEGNVKEEEHMLSAISWLLGGMAQKGIDASVLQVKLKLG